MTGLATLKKLTESDGETSYQLSQLSHISQAKAHYQSNFKRYCSLVTDCLKARLSWSDLELFKDIIVVLETQGWQKIVDESDSNLGLQDAPVQHLVRLGDRFRIPLENAGVDVEKLPEEFNDMILHATQFYSLSTMGYQAVWWRLFNSPNASEWFSCLTLTRLLLTLPVSNGKLERLFSTLKVIKVDKRSQLSNDSLDDLMVINAEHVPLKEFNPDQSIKLWWDAKLRRPNQSVRKPYTKHISTTTTSSTDDDSVVEVDHSESGTICASSTVSDTDSADTFVLDDWNEFVM